MTKNILAAALLMASAGTAIAGGQPGSIGVGGEVQLSGLGGVSVNYDTGKFHVGGFLGFNDPPGADNTLFDIGGRFFFHIAGTASSDFSLGGSIGIRSDQPAPAADRQTGLFLEPGFQIRAFITSNVALSFTGGISIGAIDASDVVIDADVVGQAGVHYYF